MERESFYKWLKEIKGYQENTVSSRVSNCQRIEEVYGDLDKHYYEDRLASINNDFNNLNHKIKINGNYSNGTSTLKQALNLYIEFKDNNIIDNVINAKDIDPDSHDGSYELVRETIESLSKVEKYSLDIKDLNLLYGMALGTFTLGVSSKAERIYDSNLSDYEKDRLSKVLEKVEKKAKKGEYSNRIDGEDRIGMFGSGFMSFREGKTTKEDVSKFINLCIDIKDMENEEDILKLAETTFKDGIGGFQAASASIILHCLKPTVFPVINGGVIDGITILEDEGVVLDRPNQLTTYMNNVRKIKKFRDDRCRFKNYRVLDMELWKLNELKKRNKKRENKVDKAWFVGAVLVNDVDYSDEFIEKGIWKNGYEDKFIDLVKTIEVGDKIAIKSTYTRKKNLHFNANNRFVSTMGIKARGTVVKNFGDGKNLKVKWERLDPIREWYFFTMRETIWEVRRSENNWMYGELLDFTFNDKEQDIDKFLNDPYWHDRYGIEEKLEEKTTCIDFSKPLDFGSLYFEDVDVLKKQISTALKSGKSIILVGPPGTGKSKLAKSISNSYDVDSKMVTAMSDWSSYDTIGGYKPSKDGSLYFEEGIFLSSLKDRQGNNKNQWLIIDEINRADIDKAFGPFFSALSSDDIELGLKDRENRNIELILEENLDEGTKVEDNQYIIPKDWRIIGTMNTFDKTSLYEMSYAFMRRFAFIPVAIPKNIDKNLIEELFSLWHIKVENRDYEYIAELWNTINEYRKVGPAIIEDIGRFIELGGDYTSSLVLYILPQLEGLFDDRINSFVNDLKKLGFINDVDRLEESVEDFFDVKLSGE